MNADTIGQLALLVPLCTIAAGVLIAAIKMRPLNRTADEAAAAGQYRRLLDWCERLERRIKTLETEAEAYRKRAVAAETRAAVAEAGELKWKAIAEGIGTNRQDEAATLAAERLAEREERK